jgi:DNA polymerase I-like protein with 3'-5' exonuclease and polymerase domains
MPVLSIYTLHDEIIVETRDAIEEQVQAIVKASMEAAFKKIIPEVPFVAEHHFSGRRMFGIVSLER